MEYGSDHEKAKAFDVAVKRHLAAGKEPQRAIDDALSETGIEATPEQKKAVLDLIHRVQKMTKDPEFEARRNALVDRIRLLCRGGMTISKAVLQAQDDVGVKLSDQGTKILIEVLERESERLERIGIDVVSEDEYKKMLSAQECVDMRPNGLPGWICCECVRRGDNSLNALSEASCRKCGHKHCFKETKPS